MEGNSWVTYDDCENTVEDEVTNVATHIGDNVTSEGSVQTNQNDEGPSNVLETSPILRRSTRQRVMPSKFNDFVVSSNVKYGLTSSNLCVSTNLNKSSEPKTFHEASQNPKWIEAMNLEMEALHRNNTYVLADLSSRRKAIGCKWIWKIKYKSSGEIDGYKARLVAKEVYMESPPGYYDRNETKVCKLNKSLYELNQAPRQWNEKLTTTLVENGFVQSKNNYALYVKSKNSIFLAILVYVDDIVVTGNKERECDQFKRFLSSRKYCLELLNDYGLLAYKPAATPLQHNVMLSHEETDNDKFLSNISIRAKVYSDADWAKCPKTRKSVLIHRCLASTTCELIWVVKNLKDLEVDGLLPAYGANPVFHEKTKHFEIDLHLVREKVSSGVVKVMKVPSANNIADIFTKGLSIAQHNEFVKNLGRLICLNHEPERGC
ncbi:ribonuclease H-like domain-containing protein [Tanacetum coccineum]